MRKKKYNIVVTNDDGIESPGIKALASALNSLGNVYIIAPKEEKSAIAHSITLHHPLRVKEIKKDKVIAVDGTPADCIVFACLHLLKEKKVDLIVSGINLGPNLGDDVTYSGTIGAAIEGTLLKIPSIAISQCGKKHNDFKTASAFIKKLAEHVLKNGLPSMNLLNINIPGADSDNIEGYLITRQGKGVYRDNIVEKHDPRGRKYFWIDGDEPKWETKDSGDTDFFAIENNYISITPLSLDMTNHSLLEPLRKNIKIKM